LGSCCLDQPEPVQPGGPGAQLHEHCEQLCREPDRNYAKVVEDAAGLAAEGLDLGIVYIAPPHDPAVLEPLAEGIRDSGLTT
jgi:hypothetical protein